MRRFNSFDHVTFSRHVLDNENRLLKELDIQSRLIDLVKKPDGCKRFANAFYFVRYDFYRLNFIVGARCGPDERYWTGLAHSLYEESGGNGGKSHNQLYRDFLSDVGVKDENTLREPTFAREFNKSWVNFCTDSPFNEALSGLAIFEILDQPDYAMLFEVVKNADISPGGLLFFKIHAQAEHFDFFEEIVDTLGKTPGGRASLERAAAFVIQNQRMMWQGLLQCLTGSNAENLGDV
jgi:pyrroloquinoline quinone (PQQ) biosynthesis protein C